MLLSFQEWKNKVYFILMPKRILQLGLLRQDRGSIMSGKEMSRKKKAEQIEEAKNSEGKGDSK